MLNANIRKALRQLSDLASMTQQTERMERSILDGAQRRLREVESSLESIGPGDAITNESVASKYEELVEERGILNQVVMKARAVLRE